MGEEQQPEINRFPVPRTLSEDGSDLEVLVIDGEPWFYGQDIGRLLGLINPTTSIGNLPERHRSSITVARDGAGPRLRTIISEPGFYRLVMRSNMPGALAFQDWVTEEVLPRIRKTGSYALSHPEALRRLADALEDRAQIAEQLEIAEASAAESERVAANAQKQVAAIEPPASAWLGVAACRGDWAMGSMARILNRDLGPGRQARLRDLGSRGQNQRVGIQHVRESMYRLGMASWDEGAQKFVPRLEADQRGMIRLDRDEPRDLSRCRITPKGLAAIHVDLGGSVPLDMNFDAGEVEDVPEIEGPREVLEGEIV